MDRLKFALKLTDLNLNKNKVKRSSLELKGSSFIVVQSLINN